MSAVDGIQPEYRGTLWATIEITNTGAVEHSITLDDDSVSQDLEPGDTATITVNVTDSTGFHGKYHPTQMTGALKVN